MNRIRSLVNAELIATTKSGDEKVMQIGSGTYFEAVSIYIYSNESGELADIVLNKEGDKLEGVTWGPQFFENHGTPETREVKKDERRTTSIIPSDGRKPAFGPR